MIRAMKAYLKTAVLFWSIAATVLCGVPSLLGVEPQAVYFHTHTKKAVEGNVYNAGSDTGIVMVHGARFTADDWHGLAVKLSDAGYTCLSIDVQSDTEDTEHDKQRIRVEIRAAIRYLQNHGCTKIVLAGAGSAAPHIARISNSEAEGRITAVILFSPEYGSKLKSESTKKLILYSSGEQFAGHIRAYYQSLPEPKKQIIYPGSDQSLQILNSKYTVLAMNDILRFLQQ